MNWYFTSVVVFLSLCCNTIFAETTIRVSPDGELEGTISLSQALLRLEDRSIRNNNGEPVEAITLQLEAGYYPLNETVKLGTASSGSAQHPVTIQGPVGGGAIISGGKHVTGFSPVTDPEILARLPEVSRGKVLQTNLREQGITDYGVQRRHGVSFHHFPTALELTYRNKPLTLARWPNKGFALIESVPDGEKGLTFTLKTAKLDGWKDEPNLLATGYWFQEWADATVPISKIDPDNNRITLKAPAPDYGIKAGKRVFIQNALSELDQSGEWYLDVANDMLYVWLPENTPTREVNSTLMEKTEGGLEASMLEKLLVINNASYIRINNITFQSARGDAIIVQGGDHVVISHSLIRNIGNRAAVISGKESGITDTLIENIGEGAIVLNAGDRQSLSPGNLYAERNTIRNFAKISFTYQPAILINGVSNRAVNNTIYEAAHTAILFTGNEHLISKNEIFNVCLDTGDAGVIYTGRDWAARGTVISGNYIHDIPANRSWGRTKSIYLDDQASGIVVRGNTFENVDEAVFIGGGRDNLVEGNIFRNVFVPIHLDARGTTWQKESVQDKNGLFVTQLKSVPYNQIPYIDRYPHLANILDDEPGVPKYNIARNNTYVGEYKINIDKEAEKGIVIDTMKSLNNQVH